MKKIFSIIILMIAILSCHKKDDDTSEVCTGNCTNFKYKIVTADSVGVKNLNYTLIRYEFFTFSSPKVRILGQGTTNSEGILDISVYLKDKELKGGSYDLVLSENNPEANKYLHREVASRIGVSIKRRDTVINRTIYIPTKAYIKLNLKNFEPLSSKDSFSAGNQWYWASAKEKNETFIIPVALKETNKIKKKMKLLLFQLHLRKPTK